MAVHTARCREPSLHPRLSTCAGSGALVVRESTCDGGPYYAGDIMALMVGGCGDVHSTEEEHRDMHGKRFVCGRGMPRARQC